MWLATKFGYYSIVKSNKVRDSFMVRARAEKDLLNLTKELFIFRKRKIKKSYDTDYMFRIFITQEELDILMVFLSKNIDYSNFKDKIHTIGNQKDKVPFYMRIWDVMFDYQFKLNGYREF